MTKHLPECLVPDFDKGLWICICNQLRACEERVGAAAHLLMVDAWLSGLDAAREAVRDECSFLPTHLCSECECAVAAINALRESK